MKILLVEDDANLREVTQRSLEKERYVVEIAADYRTALQKIEDYAVSYTHLTLPTTPYV